MLLSSAFACQFASECRDHRSVNGISIRFCSVLMLSNFIDIILNRQGSVRWLSSVVVHRGSSLRMNDPRVSSLSQAPSEVGLRWRELEPKCVAQWFLGSLLGTNQSVVKIPEVFAKVNSVQFPSVASSVAGSRRFILSNRM